MTQWMGQHLNEIFEWKLIYCIFKFIQQGEIYSFDIAARTSEIILQYF